MKTVAKYLIPLILIIPIQAMATSGACSYHGGVNCAAGAGLYGKVICNDGWTGSSVSYASMIECGGSSTYSPNSLSGTSLGEISGCDYYAIQDQTDDYTVAEWYGGVTPDKGDTIKGALHSYGFKDFYDSATGQSTHVWIEDWLLSEDQAMKILVDKCEWSGQLQNYFDGGTSSAYRPLFSSYSPITTTNCPLNASAVGSSCYCNAGYKAVGSSCVQIPTTSNAMRCTDSFGQNSKWDGTLGTSGQPNCICQSGYQWSTDRSSCIVTPVLVQTVAASSTCLNTYGVGSEPRGSNCYCSKGYSWNKSFNTCVKGNSTITKYLTIGSTDVQVVTLKNFLAIQGLYTGLVNTPFDGDTQTALTVFQAIKGISQTGTVGPKTRSIINATMQ